MQNLNELMDSFKDEEKIEIFKNELARYISVKDATERFDKQALLKLHDLGRPPTSAEGYLEFFIHTSEGSCGITSSVPLEGLKPISLTQLQVGQIHRGRVLYGTLCADAFKMTGIMTLLEDCKSRAVRLAIYNVAHSRTTNIRRLYPRGTKVTVKEPYFKVATDGGLTIRVDNPANVEMIVNQMEKQVESLLVNVEEVRKKGNSYFREEQWDAAVEQYSKCIDAALLQLRKGYSSDDNNIKTCLLHAYSNRAEASLQMNEFQQALEHSEKALSIDPVNLKALYRKGRALIGLRQYAVSCECLQKANKASRGLYKEIRDALCQAKSLYAQSRNGQYDISAKSLLGFDPSPQVADFVGPVTIKMTKDRRGRGLYTTREISTGELFLVSNAIAVAYEDSSSTSISFNVDHRGKLNMASQEDLVNMVISAAMNSQVLLRQIYSLADSSVLGMLDVPGIELLKIVGQVSRSQEEGKEKLEVNVNRIRDIISRNSFGGAKQTFASESKILEARLIQQCERNYSGLWLLPSFINHSCLPNSSRRGMGSAMFIHACRNIKRGEEITISYFDTLVPLRQRQENFKNWGFECKCRRCIVELSLGASLEPITTRFEQLHDKSTNEMKVTRSQKGFNADRPDRPISAEFSKLFLEAERIVKSFPEMITKEAKQWIRASFASAYMAGLQSNGFFPITLEDGVPSVEEIMKAIQNTVPGDIRTLFMAVRIFQEVLDLIGDGKQASTAKGQAREACIRVFGKHSEDVLEALFLNYLP